MHAFDTATPEELTAKCPAATVFLRPDGGDEPADLLLPPTTYENKILATMGQVRATNPEIRKLVEPWLEGLIASRTPSEEDLFAPRARSLLEGIRLGRDDTEAQATP